MAMEREKLVSLVVAAQNGDNDALNSLFGEFYNDLYYFALKTVKDDDTALDVTQEAFVEIIRTIGALKEPAAFVTWAKQITYHQCTRYFKKKKDVIVDEDEDGATVFDNLKEENAEFIPDEALDKDDFKKTVMSILDELSEEQRAATMMFYFDEISIKQIAEIQGVSENTIKSRLNYARKSIKASVEEYEKKNNIKLHAIPFFPLFKWLFEGSFTGSIPTATAKIIAEGVTAATGTTITAGAAAGGAAAATAAVTATTATAAGIGAKIAALPIVTKIIAGAVAAGLALGGGVATANIVAENQSSTSWASDAHTQAHQMHMQAHEQAMRAHEQAMQAHNAAVQAGIDQNNQMNQDILNNQINQDMLNNQMQNQIEQDMINNQIQNQINQDMINNQIQNDINQQMMQPPAMPPF